MTPASEKRMAKFFALVKRYNQIGCLLPDPDNFTAADMAALDETKMVMAEMHKIKAEMDAALDEENAARARADAAPKNNIFDRNFVVRLEGKNHCTDKA